MWTVISSSDVYEEHYQASSFAEACEIARNVREWFGSTVNKPHITKRAPR